MKPAKYLRATIISPINIVVLVFYQPVHARWLLRQKRWRTQRVHYVQNPILGYTDGNVQERWKLAAKALKTVIDLAPSKLYLYPNFEKLFIIQPNQNTEYIVYTGNPKNYMLELYNYPPSLLGSGGTCPSHNLVCAFEKKDGSANDMQSDTRFENMDPRFDVTIVRD